MKRYTKLALLGVLCAFAGTCLPNNYFSQLLANSGSAVAGAILSDLFDAVSPVF